MKWSLATSGALTVSGLTALTALAWLRVAVGRESWGLAIWLGAGTVALVVSAVAFYGTHRIMMRELAPLTRLADHLRSAAVRSRDHISFLRHALGGQNVHAAIEIERLEQALEQFTMRVEQRHARQMAWIVAVVHDVKTPIAGAANTLSSLSRVPRLRGTSEGELIGRVSEELRGLVLDVQRVVDAVRFERDDIEIDLQPVNLAEVTEAIASRVASDRPDVGVAVRGRGACHGDATLISRAIENLIANAVRHARQSVTVDVSPGLVRVADDGPGLPAPLEVLAQPFRSESIEVGGGVTAGGAGGIGLFLAKRALEAHGGRLVVEATSAQGTTLLAYLGTPRHG